MKKTLTLSLSTLALISAATAQASTTESAVQSTKETEKKMMKQVSADMNVIMEKLESDWDFIGKFLDNPEKTVASYKLTEEEVNALTTRDLDGLMNLGLSAEEVTVAMSGTHRGGSIGTRN